MMTKFEIAKNIVDNVNRSNIIHTESYPTDLIEEFDRDLLDGGSIYGCLYYKWDYTYIRRDGLDLVVKIFLTLEARSNTEAVTIGTISKAFIDNGELVLTIDMDAIHQITMIVDISDGKSRGKSYGLSYDESYPSDVYIGPSFSFQ